MRHQRILLMTLLLSVLPAVAAAQTGIVGYGGMGYTAVDKQEWTGLGTLNASNQTMYQFNGQVLFSLPGRRLSLGAEGGYDYFFWYRRTPSPASYVDVTAFHALAVLDAHITHGDFVELAAGPHFFDGYADFGMYGAVGHRIRLGEQLLMPIKVRAGAIVDSKAPIFTVGALVGLEYVTPRHRTVAIRRR